MGGVCSKSSTKKKKEEAKEKEEAPPAPAVQPEAAANATKSAKADAENNSDPHYPVRSPEDVELEDAAGAAPGGLTKETASNFTLSTNERESRGNLEATMSVRPGSPDKLNTTRPANTAADPKLMAAPPKGESYDKWFPPEHDKGMKLGDGKYDGVGVQTPSSDAQSAELHSIASTPKDYRVPSPVSSTPAPPPPPPKFTQPRGYDPMRFVDEDSAAPETASSAFVTPRELRDASSAASVADNVSLVSHGSMASLQPHGYSYYNSTNTQHDAYPSASSHRQSIGSASMASGTSLPPAQRSNRNTAMTVTSVRTNRQVPAASSAGMRSPLTRQSSLAGSERFQSCRSLGDASASAASYLPPNTPTGGRVTEADVLLLSAQQGGNFSGRRPASYASPLSSHYPPSSAASNLEGSGANNFYSCRSLTAASEQSAMSPLMGSTRVASPIVIQRPGTASSLQGLNTASNQSSNSLSNMRGVVPLPPRSPRGSPMVLSGNTPVAQQEFLFRQASRQSGLGDRPASEAFFSVGGGSSRDVFLDLPTAAEASTVYTLDDDAEPDSASQQQQRELGSTLNSDVMSPASHYSSVAASAKAGGVEPPPESLDSPQSSSASSAWLASPVVSKTKVPPRAERNDGEGSSVASSPKSSTRNNTASHRSDAAPLPPPPQKRKMTAVPAKQYYTKADFPPNPTTPPQAKGLAPVDAAGSAGSHQTTSTATKVELALADSTYVTLSTPSESSTRKSGGTRPTLKYTAEAPREIDGDEMGDAVRPRALEQAPAPVIASDVVAVDITETTTTTTTTTAMAATQHDALPTVSSTHSFSTVASSYKQQQQMQQQSQTGASSPNSSQVDSQGNTGAAAGRAKKSAKTSTSASTPTARPARRRQPVPKRSTTKPRSSAQLGRARGTRGSAGGPAAPTMVNPNPWVPGGTNAATRTAHVDPFIIDKDGQVHAREYAPGATPHPVSANPNGTPTPIAGAGAASVPIPSTVTPGTGSSATTPRTPGGSRVRRSSTPGGTLSRATGIAPGRHAPTALAAGAASTPPPPPPAAAVKAASTGTMHTAAAAHTRSPPNDGNLTWSSLEAPPSTSATAKPIAKLASAAKARKAKKAAPQHAEADTAPKAGSPLATPPPAAQALADPSASALRAVDSAGDSVVEYELFTGELADVEMDSTAEDTDNASAQAAMAAQQQQQQQQPSMRNPPAFRTSPQLRAERQRGGAFYVSPDMSPPVLTSAETSDFMQPFTEAQLQAELTDTTAPGTDLTSAVWVSSIMRETGEGVMVQAELAEARRVAEEEENDEGYDADSGMPNAHEGTLPQSAMPSAPPPRSVSATSPEDEGMSSAAVAAAAAVAPLMHAQSEEAAAEAIGEGEVAALSAADAAALTVSSDSESEISVASPVVVG